jgi:hypothetical protein
MTSSASSSVSTRMWRACAFWYCSRFSSKCASTSASVISSSLARCAVTASR